MKCRQGRWARRRAGGAQLAGARLVGLTCTPSSFTSRPTSTAVGGEGSLAAHLQLGALAVELRRLHLQAWVRLTVMEHQPAAPPPYVPGCITCRRGCRGCQP